MRGKFLCAGMVLGVAILIGYFFIAQKQKYEFKDNEGRENSSNILENKQTITEFRQLIIDSAYAKITGVKQFGPLRLGDELPLDAGIGTVWSREPIPKSKFYVFVVKNNFLCMTENCGVEGALVKTMGGWFEGFRLDERQNGEDFGFGAQYGLPDIYESLVAVADSNRKIIGLYPNKDKDDLIAILKQWPELVDFSLLRGTDNFGPLKIGEYAPLRPGDKIEDNRQNTIITNVFLDQRFYVYAFHKEFMDTGFCHSFACYNTEHFDLTREDGYNGWFSGHSDPPTLTRFGLDPEKVKKGEQSLVVVTDNKGKIVAIHPGKNKYDVLSILWQIPEAIGIDVAEKLTAI